MKTADVDVEMPDRSLRARLKHWTGLDRAIGFTIMARFWSAIAGITTVLLIAHFLTPKEQGYYYTFSSLVALQIVFELGFSFVVLQLAAHERAQLTFAPDGVVEGNGISHSRLASVLQKSVRWYSMAAVVMAAALLPTGWYFFSTHQHGTDVAWKVPWFLLVLAVTLVFQLDPVFSFLEGCGLVLQVAQMRLAQAVIGSTLAWAAMATHHGLFAPVMVIFGQASVGLTFVLTSPRRQLLKGLLRFQVGPHKVGWRDEIWPFQWRIAVSWISGYFIFQLFNPVLFAYQGPVAAGRMGMSLSISSSIGAVAIAWMSTKASPFGNLIARGEIVALDKLFFRTLWQSTLMLASEACAFILVLLVVRRYFPKQAMRVLPPWAFALLLMATIVNHVVFSQAIYLRAHKREPFLVQSVVAAILLAASTVLLGKWWGANAVTVGYFTICALVGFPMATFIFLTKRREWHRQSAESRA